MLIGCDDGGEGMERWCDMPATICAQNRWPMSTLMRRNLSNTRSVWLARETLREEAGPSVSLCRADKGWNITPEQLDTSSQGD